LRCTDDCSRFAEIRTGTAATPLARSVQRVMGEMPMSRASTASCDGVRAAPATPTTAAGHPHR
jgi:hypothetical protein